jgi:hypothetical protein
MVIVLQTMVIFLVFTSTSFLHICRFPRVNKAITTIVILMNCCAIILELIFVKFPINQKNILISSILIQFLIFGLSEILCRAKYIKKISNLIKIIIESSPQNLNNRDIQKLILKTHDEYISLADIEKAHKYVLKNEIQKHK